MVLDSIEALPYRLRRMPVETLPVEGAEKETNLMPKFVVRIEDTGEQYACADSRSVLVGMEALGKKGIPVGCRQGGCGVCKVQVLEGEFTRRVMSRAHVSAEEEQGGCVLSCRIYPSSDLRIRVVGSMKKNVCRPALPTGTPSVETA